MRHHLHGKLAVIVMKRQFVVSLPNVEELLDMCRIHVYVYLNSNDKFNI